MRRTLRIKVSTEAWRVRLYIHVQRTWNCSSKEQAGEQYTNPAEDPDLEHVMERAGEQALKEAQEKAQEKASKESQKKALQGAREKALKEAEEQALVAADAEQQGDAGDGAVQSDIRSGKEPRLNDEVDSAGASRSSEPAPTKSKLLINLTCGIVV